MSFFEPGSHTKSEDGDRSDRETERLKALALTVRRAMELMDPDEFPDSVFLRYFPSGCCGYASGLLSRYLQENGIRAELVWGMDDERKRHAWLECRGFIVDITADQFPENDERVLITRSRELHARFHVQTRSPDHFDEFHDQDYWIRLELMYQRLLRIIEGR